MPIFLIWSIAEIYIFATFAEYFGFLHTLLCYFVPTFLGFFLLAQLKNHGLQRMQANWQKGKEPSADILHATAKIVGAVLLIPPTFFTRIVGLLLVTPGIRHILVFIGKVYFIKKIATAGSSFFQSGGGGFTFYSSAKGFPGFNNHDVEYGQELNQERDVEAIDVTPLEITHKDKKET